MIEQIALITLAISFVIFIVQMKPSKYASLWILFFIIAVSLMYAFYKIFNNPYLFFIVLLLLLIKPIINKIKK